MPPKLFSISMAIAAKALIIALVSFPEVVCMSVQAKDKDALIEVHSSQEIITGVTTTKDGRIFFEYPHLDGSSGMRIGELNKDGMVSPFPDAAWNNWVPGQPTEHTFVRTNSLRIGPDGMLWVVDTGTARFGEEILQGGVKLVAIDLRANKVARVFPLAACTYPKSFVDDVRFHSHYAILTDAGSPALILLDLNTGVARRVLEHEESTTAQRIVVASGTPLHTADGKTVKIHADQLEVSPDGEYLYFQALTGPMYRVETRYLEDARISKRALAEKVIFFSDTPTTGGTAIDSAGTIYLSDVEKRRLLAIDPSGGIKVLLEDKRLDWPDAMWIDAEGYLWLPVAQLDQIAPFQGGTSRVIYPIKIYKMRVSAQ